MLAVLVGSMWRASARAELLLRLKHLEVWISENDVAGRKARRRRRLGVGGRTDGSRLDHVADGKSLDCLVLWGATGAVGASDWVHVSASLLVAAVGGALLDHFGGFWGVLEGGLWGTVCLCCRSSSRWLWALT